MSKLNGQSPHWDMTETAWLTGSPGKTVISLVKAEPPLLATCIAENQRLHFRYTLDVWRPCHSLWGWTQQLYWRKFISAICICNLIVLVKTQRSKLSEGKGWIVHEVANGTFWLTAQLSLHHKGSLQHLMPETHTAACRKLPCNLYANRRRFSRVYMATRWGHFLPFFQVFRVLAADAKDNIKRYLNSLGIAPSLLTCESLIIATIIKTQPTIE